MVVYETNPSIWKTSYEPSTCLQSAQARLKHDKKENESREERASFISYGTSVLQF